jgi:hypothetical protein
VEGTGVCLGALRNTTVTCVWIAGLRVKVRTADLLNTEECEQFVAFGHRGPLSACENKRSPLEVSH